MKQTIKVPTPVYEGYFAKNAADLASKMNEAIAEGKTPQVIPLHEKCWLLVEHKELRDREIEVPDGFEIARDGMGNPIGMRPVELPQSPSVMPEIE